jgi:probable HAF family extracellular repeat protein
MGARSIKTKVESLMSTSFKCRPLRASLLAASLALAALPSMATQYTLTDVGSLGGAYANTYATGLNASGQVVGFGYGGYVVGTGPFNMASTGIEAFTTAANAQGIQPIAPLAGYAWSRANGINDAGQIVGTSGNAAGNTLGFTVAPGSMNPSSLGTLGGAKSTADAINASGQVVGVSADAGGVVRPYIAAAGGPLAPLTLAWSSQYVSVGGVNASGQVVGSGGDYGAAGNAFVTGPNGSNPQNLPGAQIAPGHTGYSPRLLASGVNDKGQIVGAYAEVAGVAFLKNADGTDLPLSFANAPDFLAGNRGGYGQYGPNTSTYANAVNNSGQVVGTISRNDMGALGRSYAFITGANGTDLVEVSSLSFANLSAPLDYYFTSASAINDAGDFLANASNGHAYLIRAVPEPATGVLLLGGLGFVGAALRRHRKG